MFRDFLETIDVNLKNEREAIFEIDGSLKKHFRTKESIEYENIFLKLYDEKNKLVLEENIENHLIAGLENIYKLKNEKSLPFGIFSTGTKLKVVIIFDKPVTGTIRCDSYTVLEEPLKLYSREVTSYKEIPNDAKYLILQEYRALYNEDPPKSIRKTSVILELNNGINVEEERIVYARKEPRYIHFVYDISSIQNIKSGSFCEKELFGYFRKIYFISNV